MIVSTRLCFHNSHAPALGQVPSGELEGILKERGAAFARPFHWATLSTGHYSQQPSATATARALTSAVVPSSTIPPAAAAAAEVVRTAPITPFSAAGTPSTLPPILAASLGMRAWACGTVELS